MDSQELSEWMAYARLEPFGEPWARNALLCSVIANCLVGKANRRFEPSQFLPGGKPLGEEQTPEEMRASIRAFVEAFNDSVSRGGHRQS